MRRALVLFLVLSTAAGACTSGDQESGFTLSADQLAPATTTTTSAVPDEARWDVEVATAKTDVVLAACQPPEGLLEEDESTEESTEDSDAESGVTTTVADSTTTTVATAPNGCPVPEPPEGQPQLSAIPGANPNVGSAQVLGGWSFNNPTYFENPLVFLVLENHGEWLEVMVPTRPNQQVGWIQAEDVELSTIRWHAQINVTNNNLKVWNGDELVVDTGIVDGRETTPTPIGRFYFTEKIEKWPSSDYGSWVLSTNGYSNALETFNDGLPVFAVHGTPYDDQIGSDISNGCVRIPNRAIELMAERVPMGTPVEVVA